MMLQKYIHSSKTVIHYLGRLNVLATQPTTNILQIPFVQEQ